MSSPCYVFFETAIGACALVWNARGVVGSQLPMARGGAAERRLRARFPGAEPSEPAPFVAGLIERVQEHLAGGTADLSTAPLDFTDLQPFEAAVYETLRRVPPGKTVTYGELARRVGRPGAARAVGKAMGDNPWPILVPCHRVVGADAKAGGFSAPGGLAIKARILTIERAQLDDEPLLFDGLPLAVKPAPARRTAPSPDRTPS